MSSYLDFEKPIAELEGKLRELRHISGSGSEVNITDEVHRIEKKVERLLKETYANLNPAQKVQVARHPERPHALNYIDHLITEFQPLSGDRYFSEDHAIVAGLGRFEGETVAVLGQEKGSDTETRVHHNFGMANPEGYRKAIRVMDLAEKFKIPLLSFVDTAGAYPGVGAEERGQAEAIARSIEKCLSVKIPFVSVVIGEGGSGGAIALAAADKVLMLEHAIYSVITPEGCASILWRDTAKASEAATALNITAQDLKRLKVIDEIIEEPLGGAHRDVAMVMSRARLAINRAFMELKAQDFSVIRAKRIEKFIAMGNNL